MRKGKVVPFSKEQYYRFRSLFRMPPEPQDLTWGQAFLLLEGHANREVEVSTDGWMFPGKCFFMDSRGDGPRELMFRNQHGVEYAHTPNAADRAREDWRIGRSRGRQK